MERPAVDAIVGYFRDGEEVLRRAARGVPVVLIERPASLPGIHSVRLDFESGVDELVSQLRARAATRFGMIDRHPSRPGVEYAPSPRRLASREPQAPDRTCRAVRPGHRVGHRPLGQSGEDHRTAATARPLPGPVGAGLRTGQSSMTSNPCSRSRARLSNMVCSTSGGCGCQSSNSPTTRSRNRVR